jgi:hypothetical protein
MIIATTQTTTTLRINLAFAKTRDYRWRAEIELDRFDFCSATRIAVEGLRIYNDSAEGWAMHLARKMSCDRIC